MSREPPSPTYTYINLYDSVDSLLEVKEFKRITDEHCKELIDYFPLQQPVVFTCLQACFDDPLEHLWFEDERVFEEQRIERPLVHEVNFFVGEGGKLVAEKVLAETDLSELLEVVYSLHEVGFVQVE